MEKSAVIITFKNASEFSKEGRKDIANWLRQQAKDLIRYGDNYSKVCRARYLYKD